ncbi:hypothetical protein, partial [Streptococcus pneumoniae]|uniref:hypothetical protein n=1 Tax=Streptococcus pneumoniae TaxID=1313 RepID=UPI001E31F25D
LERLIQPASLAQRQARQPTISNRIVRGLLRFPCFRETLCPIGGHTPPQRDAMRETRAFPVVLANARLLMSIATDVELRAVLAFAEMA